jgi:hypothetical protein
MIKPILFNTKMVQAIIDGRKTQTRRPIKFQMKEGYNPEFTGYSIGEYFTGHIESGVCLYSRGYHDVWGVRSNVIKPKYLKDDVLYVRETFQYVPSEVSDGIAVVYKASENGIAWEDNSEDWTWKPSIHMPKEAARLFLKVTNVRAERLKDMTENDANAEGIKNIYDKKCNIVNKDKLTVFNWLWDSIYPDYLTSKNPWVFVYEFEVCDKPND